jgi:Xaa-Pro aminopeptidase
MVCVDAGAAFRGWASDVCRTVAAGAMSEKHTRLYEVLRTAEEKVIANIKPGAKTSELFEIGMSSVKERG